MSKYKLPKNRNGLIILWLIKTGITNHIIDLLTDENYTEPIISLTNKHISYCLKTGSQAKTIWYNTK